MKTSKELEALPDDELRVMLAELCGWKKLASPEPLLWTRDGVQHVVGHAPWRGPDGRLKQDEDLPNYPQDLNACHELEVTLDEDQYKHFALLLVKLTAANRPFYTGYQYNPTDAIHVHSMMHAISTEPRHRTIALILTLQQS